MEYVNISYVDENIQPYDANDTWVTWDDETKTRRINWAERELNKEEYIGIPLDTNTRGYAFPREILEDANERELLDTNDIEGRATLSIQRKIYDDNLNPAPESIKQAVVQMIVEYIENVDYKELQKLHNVADLGSFDVFTFKDTTWYRNLPKSVWEIISYLKPITWDESIESTRVARA